MCSLNNLYFLPVYQVLLCSVLIQSSIYGHLILLKTQYSSQGNQSILTSCEYTSVNETNVSKFSVPADARLPDRKKSVNSFQPVCFFFLT